MKGGAVKLDLSVNQERVAARPAVKVDVGEVDIPPKVRVADVDLLVKGGASKQRILVSLHSIQPGAPLKRCLHQLHFALKDTVAEVAIGAEVAKAE